MEEEKVMGHFLRDPKTGFLWLHDTEYNDFCFSFRGEILDLATCIDEEHEIVSALHYGLFISYDLLVAKNEDGLYAVFAPFRDSMGYGNLYASISPGFPYKSVYGFAIHWTIYVIAETTEGRWGMIQIVLSRSEWLYPAEFVCVPTVVVEFEYNSMEEVQSHYPIAFLPCDVFRVIHWSHGMGDLTRVEEGNFAKGSMYWGKTTEEIKWLRKSGDAE